MKIVSLALSLALMLSASSALAQGVGVDVSADVDARGQSAEHRNGNDVIASTSSRGNAAANASSTEAGNNAEASVEGRAVAESRQGSSTASSHGTLMAESHRSVVATFVQSLLAVADRDGGIGAEVSAVAQSQSDAASTTIEAITKVENRSKVLEFLLGTDWKSIGVLRSQIARGEADLARLEAALVEADDATVRAEIEAQIEVFEAEQEKIQEFVTEHESAFSLLGWLVRLLV